MSSNLELLCFFSDRGITRRHRTLPVASSRHSSSPPVVLLYLGSPMRASLVPIYTRPPATTGEEYVSFPNRTTHRTFRVVARSMPEPSAFFSPGTNDAGSPFSVDTMFRQGVPPHMGQSFAEATDEQTAAPASSAVQIRSRGSRTLRFT